MNDAQLHEAGLPEWNGVLRRVWPLVKSGYLVEVISQIDAFLSLEMEPEARSSALGFHALMQERLGNIKEAQKEYLEARLLTGPSYQRYVHELSLGSLFERQAFTEEAQAWYRTALKTCLLDDETSGGAALKNLLQLCRTTNLSADDLALCRKVIEHSSRVLRLTHPPDLSDLEAAVSVILDAEGKPIPGS